MSSSDRFTKRSFSSDGACVEVRLLDDGTILLRDSKNRSKRSVRFTPAEWHAFLAGVRAGEFDLSRNPRGATTASLIVKLQVRLPGWVWGAVGGAGATTAIHHLLAR